MALPTSPGKGPIPPRPPQGGQPPRQNQPPQQPQPRRSEPGQGQPQRPAQAPRQPAPQQQRPAPTPPRPPQQPQTAPQRPVAPQQRPLPPQPPVYEEPIYDDGNQYGYADEQNYGYDEQGYQLEDDAFQPLSPEEVAAGDDWGDEAWDTQVDQEPDNWDYGIMDPVPEPVSPAFTSVPPAPVERPAAQAPAPAQVHNAPNPIEEEFDSDFINEPQKKLLPFGGNKSRKNVDNLASEYDARENRLMKAKLIQTGALVLAVGILGLAGFKVLGPSNEVTPAQMNAAIEAAVYEQSFPLERGASFAEDFLSAYLSIPQGSIASNNELLSYYYTGSLSGEGANIPLSVSGVSQTILVQPKVFDSTITDTTAAAYVVGALVQPENYGDGVEPYKPTTPLSDKAKWVYYNINVFYDEKTNTMAVTQDSPSLLPPMQFGSSGDIPEEKLLGTGEADNDLKADVQSSLYSFLENFAKASASDPSPLVNNLYEGTKTDNAALLTGMNGQFTLAGSAAEAINYTAYPSDTDSDAAKLDVRVTWEDAATKGNSSQLRYTSRYYIEMRKASSGAWLVSAFAPKYYLQADND